MLMRALPFMPGLTETQERASLELALNLVRVDALWSLNGYSAPCSCFDAN